MWTSNNFPTSIEQNEIAWRNWQRVRDKIKQNIVLHWSIIACTECPKTQRHNREISLIMIHFKKERIQVWVLGQPVCLRFLSWSAEVCYKRLFILVQLSERKNSEQKTKSQFHIETIFKLLITYHGVSNCAKGCMAIKVAGTINYYSCEIYHFLVNSSQHKLL